MFLLVCVAGIASADLRMAGKRREWEQRVRGLKLLDYGQVRESPFDRGAAEGWLRWSAGTKARSALRAVFVLPEPCSGSAQSGLIAGPMVEGEGFHMS
jgi:hypothetical protein